LAESYIKSFDLGVSLRLDRTLTKRCFSFGKSGQNHCHPQNSSASVKILNTSQKHF